MLKQLITGLSILLLTQAAIPCAQAQTANTAISKHEHTIPMSSEEVQNISQSSTRVEISAALQHLDLSAYADTVANVVANVMHGGTQNFCTTIATGSKSLTDQNTLNVSVKYDPRPVGGILSIRVEVVPLFAGIGTPMRAIASRELAQAVDQFDEEMVTKTVQQLTNELSAQIAMK
jgi:hypothetical protein